MDGKDWKWWYFVVAGFLIIAFGCYQVYELRIGKSIGSFLLGFLAIFVGFASRPDGHEPAEVDDNDEVIPVEVIEE
ncbi:hypothetical protein [Stieleria varia]|uniref:Uncharacterized protein n=1 Tax=Stieleria varia TaxID=2528005 RepID=A0A5C6B1G0_9BACT|nr:hypothetical protein [Stieleria varia]TWU05647.1 hypothetical protein Pla52n_13620 [Stieleria varia]